MFEKTSKRIKYIFLMDFKSLRRMNELEKEENHVVKQNLKSN
jgi:hypothetical protein